MRIVSNTGKRQSVDNLGVGELCDLGWQLVGHSADEDIMMLLS